MDIKYEKMLFYNDLLEYQCSNEGKKLDFAFKNNVNYEILKKCIDNYYNARNNNDLHYDNLQELAVAKNTDIFIANLYKEQN